jgi:hypothetical protein
MTWTPITTVTVSGTDYTGNAINIVRILRGRQNVNKSIQAAVATVTLLDTDGTGIIPAIGDTLTITLENSIAVAETIFAGQITDFTASLYDAGITNQPAAVTQIVAVSPLSQIARQKIFQTGRPVEFDGTRILTGLQESNRKSWEETPGTWAAQTTSWQNAATFFDLEQVDIPGVFNFNPLDPNADGYAALATLDGIASNAFGVLYDTGDGRVGYADKNRRSNTSFASAISLAANQIEANSLTVQSQLGDVTNVLTFTFPSGAPAIYRRVPSIQKYGRRQTTIATPLAGTSMTDPYANAVLNAREEPVADIGAVSVRLDNTNVTDAIRDALIVINVNEPIKLPNVVTLQLASFEGFVEGIQFTIDPYTASISLYVSDKILSDA